MTGTTHTLEVWGDLACFTRPEMKVERFSYPIITPSAARGIFDAIYWEGIREQRGRASFMRPYFHWQVTRIEVLEMPRYIALRRNEVKDRVPAERTVKAWMAGRQVPEPIWADASKNDLGTDQKGRTQRQTMALKNVHYRISARIEPKAGFASHALPKLEAMFKRRAVQGKSMMRSRPTRSPRALSALFASLAEHRRGRSIRKYRAAQALLPNRFIERRQVSDGGAALRALTYISDDALLRRLA